ncbi:MAG: PD-(D/E)XK nuclease family protein [bacterium]
MLIEHISVSRSQTWQTCEQQYKYKYHLKIPVKFEKDYFTYGKVIHKIAEEYVKNKGERDINEITKDILTGVMPYEYDKTKPILSQDHSKKLPNHVRQVKNLSDKIGFSGEIEWKFHYDLCPPKQQYITGFIDRLIIKGDKYFILDYKTTKKGIFRKTKNTIKDDLQLKVYARVIQKHFGAKAENIHAALYFFEGAELISTKFSEEDLVKAEEELHKIYENIENTHPDNAQGNVTDACYRCDYKNICPFYNLV